MARIDATDTGSETTSGSDGNVTFDPTTGTFDLEIDFWKAFLASAPPTVATFLILLSTLPESGARALASLARDPIGFLEAGIEEIIFRRLLRPAFDSLFAAGLGAARQLNTIIYGSDFTIGIAEGSSPGILDTPFLASGPIAGTIGGLFQGAVLRIQDFNAGIGNSLEPFGLAAPAFVTFLWVLEFGILAVLVYYVIARWVPILGLLGRFR